MGLSRPAICAMGLSRPAISQRSPSDLPAICAIGPSRLAISDGSIALSDLRDGPIAPSDLPGSKDGELKNAEDFGAVLIERSP